MSKGGRLTSVVALFLVVVGLVVWAVASLLTPGVPGGVVNFTNTQAAGQPVHLTVQTVGSIGFGAHPTWVSYLVKDPKTGKWVHDTSWELLFISSCDLYCPCSALDVQSSFPR